MNTSKFFLGLALILFATIGAFATAKNTVLAPVFYEDALGICLPGDATPCGPIGSRDCVVSVVDAGTSLPVGPFQIFDAQDILGNCIDPYDRP